MDYKSVSWDKYTDESLDFILDQSEKLLEETFKSFREVINKSYIALAIYVSIISYCYNEIIAYHTSIIKTIPYCVLICGTGYCIYLIWDNLFPTKMSFLGSQPRVLIDRYFEQFSDNDQIRVYKASKIADYDEGISTNKIQIDKRNDNFKWSAKTLFMSIFISLLFYWLCRP